MCLDPDHVIDVEEAPASAAQDLLVGAGRQHGEPGIGAQIGPALFSGVDVVKLKS
jgi:hypothetical protein